MTESSIFSLFSLQRLKFEIAEVMTEIEQLTCVGERWDLLFNSLKGGTWWWSEWIITSNYWSFIPRDEPVKCRSSEVFTWLKVIYTKGNRGNEVILKNLIWKNEHILACLLVLIIKYWLNFCPFTSLKTVHLLFCLLCSSETLSLVVSSTVNLTPVLLCVLISPFVWRTKH